MKQKIFISYQRQNQKQIEDLAAALTQTGNYEVWYDQQLQVGTQWWDEIIRQIDLADSVILALTPDYFTSDYCKREWQRAHDSKKILIPIRLDPTLAHKDIPPDITKWQVMDYDGSATHFQKLDRALRAAAPNSLLNNRLVIGGVIALVVVVIAALLLSQANKPPSEATLAPTSVAQVTNTTPSSENNTSALPTKEVSPTPDAPTATVPAAEPGPFGLTLIYGGQDSFTVYLSGESHLADLTLETTDGVATLTEDFSALASSGFVGLAGVCLRYIRENTSPVPPRSCKKDTTYELVLSGDGIFWYDDRGNQYRDIVLKKGGMLVGMPCPNASGSGRCELSG